MDMKTYRLKLASVAALALMAATAVPARSQNLSSVMTVANETDVSAIGSLTNQNLNLELTVDEARALHPDLVREETVRVPYRAGKLYSYRTQTRWVVDRDKLQVYLFRRLQDHDSEFDAVNGRLDQVAPPTE